MRIKAWHRPGTAVENSPFTRELKTSEDRTYSQHATVEQSKECISWFLKLNNVQFKGEQMFFIEPLKLQDGE